LALFVLVREYDQDVRGLNLSNITINQKLKGIKMAVFSWSFCTSLIIIGFIWGNLLHCL